MQATRFHMSLKALMAAFLVVGVGGAGPFGMAKQPPMGWRSWNCYGRDVTQTKMMAVMDKMVEKHDVPSKNTTMSLVDLGYVNCGLDDNWQACGTGYNGSFHDAHGNPLVNKERFPSMKGMTDYGHQLGLRVGWYMNNCIC
eukprot:Sspe_Gene.106027::Locus_83163_Transcript_1_1_Confidence_1.000_Length_460::g.106027::m.106027/K07407/E3.2.1.22B, galA, rafA; alpha-galactosidase